jgi:hypothetical protein
MFTAFTVEPIRVEFETIVLTFRVDPASTEKPMFTAFIVEPRRVD